MLLSAVPVAAEASAIYNPFSDIAAGVYYYDAVLWAVEEEITNGVGQGRFDPQGFCTRAQAVTFLWRAAGSPQPTNRRNPFRDVTANAYYYTAVLWAVEQGLTNGVASGVFGADQQCTRAQIATFLYRLTDDTATAGASNPFSDVAAGSYYYHAVLWAVKKGITNGMGDGKFAPDQSCTRGQIVTFMHRGKALFEPPIVEEEEKEEEKEQEKEEEVLLPAGAWRFYNKYDGYSLMIGEEFFVDLSLAGVVAKLYNDDTVIEIYKQSTSNISADYYTNQLYTFLGNKTDHTLTLQETRTYAGRNVKVTAWHRDALSKVEGDKNYYLYFDVVEADAVYSIYIKSSRKDLKPEQYCYLPQTLELFAPTKKAPTFQGAPVQKQWSEETAAFYETYYGAAAEQTWGIMEPNAAKSGDFTVVDAYEDALNYDFSVLSTYSGFSDESLALLDQRLQNAWADGKVLQLSLQPDSAKKGNILYEILQGTWDDVLDVYVQKIQAFGHPVMIRLMNEMNGNWCEYSGVFSSNDPLIYKEAYRYIYRRFEDAGVDNVLWIWNPNGISYPTVDWNHTLMYYPGDEYVDIVGLTAFNTGTYYASAGETWKDFTTLYKDLYTQYCDWFEHPLMFTGFACAEMGGDKRAWTEDMFQKIGEYDRAKVLVWWDSVDYDLRDPQNPIIARDYRIQSVFDLFMKYIGTPDPIVPEDPDPNEPDPETPDPEEPDPENPEDPDPNEPDPENPDPDEPGTETPDPEPTPTDPENPTQEPTTTNP